MFWSLHVYSLQFTLSTFHFSKTISRRYSVTALQRYSVTLSFFMYHLFALDERKEESEEKDDKTEVKDE